MMLWKNKVGSIDIFITDHALFITNIRIVDATRRPFQWMRLGNRDASTIHVKCLDYIYGGSVVNVFGAGFVIMVLMINVDDS